MDVDVDYRDSANWDEQVPARFAWLREHAPVYWSEASDLWVVTSYAEVLEVSKDQGRFTSELGVRPNDPVVHSTGPSPAKLVNTS